MPGAAAALMVSLHCKLCVAMVVTEGRQPRSRMYCSIKERSEGVWGSGAVSCCVVVVLWCTFREPKCRSAEPAVETELRAHWHAINLRNYETMSTFPQDPFVACQVAVIRAIE